MIKYINSLSKCLPKPIVNNISTIVSSLTILGWLWIDYKTSTILIKYKFVFAGGLLYTNLIHEGNIKYFGILIMLMFFII